MGGANALPTELPRLSMYIDIQGLTTMPLANVAQFNPMQNLGWYPGLEKRSTAGLVCQISHYI